MATFPILKTGAPAQYPLEYATRFSTHTVQFLDGGRQSYQLSGAGLRRWRLKLDLLDERELAAVIAFVDQQGSSSFTFVDPGSGASVEKCVLAEDPFEAVMEREMAGRATLVIEEIR